MVSTSVSFKDIAATLDRANPDALRGHFDSVAADLLARLEGHAATIPVGPARAHLFASLACSYERANDPAKAQKLVNRALNSSEKIEDLGERIESLSSTAVVLHQGGLTAGAEEALARAQSIADALDRDTRGEALLLVAAAFDRAGRTSCGVEALRRALPVEEELPEAVEVVADEPEVLEALDTAEAVADDVAVLEEAEVLEELPELPPVRQAPVAPTPTPKAQEPAPVAPATEAATGTWKAPSKGDIDEGDFVDPVAGVKFPPRRSRRRG